MYLIPPIINKQVRRHLQINRLELISLVDKPTYTNEVVTDDNQLSVNLLGNRQLYRCSILILTFAFPINPCAHTRLRKPQWPSFPARQNRRCPSAPNRFAHQHLCPPPPSDGRFIVHAAYRLAPFSPARMRHPCRLST